MQHNEHMENMALLYAYGELGADAELEFCAHLKNCPRCQSVIRVCALANASLEIKKAPGFNMSLAQKPQPAGGILDYIAPLFNPRRLLPAGAIAFMLAFAGFAAYKYGAVNNKTDYFAENMYAEITNIEYILDDIDEIFGNFVSLKKEIIK